MGVAINDADVRLVCVAQAVRSTTNARTYWTQRPENQHPIALGLGCVLLLPAHAPDLACLGSLRLACLGGLGSLSLSEPKHIRRWLTFR